ncbi:MAG: hypothetical protein MUO50_01405, partial [Longimicrobiales bacterium]|nr:hypothetical protein [Longimicrobiales bacterium]
MRKVPATFSDLARRILSALFSLSLLVAAGPLAAQQASGAFAILIPDFPTTGGVDRSVGRNMARFLREGFTDLITHRAIPREEIQDQANALDMKMHQMDCTQTRQLASRMGAQVSLCVDLVPGEEDRLRVTATFWDMGSDTFFSVPPFEVETGDARAGAQRIMEGFQTYVDQARASRFCMEYGQPGDRERAMANCDRAIELGPQDTQALLQRARLLMEAGSRDPALRDLDQLLEVNPIHEEALQLAGYLAIQAGRDEMGRSYYRRYLELQPDA